MTPDTEPTLAHEASLDKIATISDDIIYGLHDQLTGDAIMGLALTIARLLSPELNRSPEEDGKFITELIDWSMARLTPINEMN